MNYKEFAQKQQTLAQIKEAIDSYPEAEISGTDR